MSSAIATTESEIGNDIEIGLAKLAELPAWLLAPLQPERVLDSLRRHVPEFAAGDLALLGVKIKRIVLDDTARWVGTYELAIDDPAAGRRTIALRGTFTPPDREAITVPLPGEAFGAEGWRGALPDLGVQLEPEPPESELPALSRLTDAEESRALLEAGIRAVSPAYADLRIAACRPEVLSYKPGSRCTLRYHLTYPPALADRGWPEIVIAKTYRKESKARNAYEGMVALWNTALSRGDAVTIAEPLAFIPELKVMVQGPIAGDRSLEDLLDVALESGSPETLAQVEAYMRKAAAGLAAIHRSGARYGEAIDLDGYLEKTGALIDSMSAAVPELRGAAEPLLARLLGLAAAHPAGARVPTHGTFSPEQVLIDGERIGVIDFDNFSMAEPALDVGRYRAAIKEIGMKALDGDASLAARESRLDLLQRLCDVFADAYALHAPLARERVALWETWSYFRDVLHCWIKVKPAGRENAMAILSHHLRGMGLLRSA